MDLGTPLCGSGTSTLRLHFSLAMVCSSTLLCWQYWAFQVLFVCYDLVVDVILVAHCYTCCCWCEGLCFTLFLFSCFSQLAIVTSYCLVANLIIIGFEAVSHFSIQLASNCKCGEFSVLTGILIWPLVCMSGLCFTMFWSALLPLRNWSVC